MHDVKVGQEYRFINDKSGDYTIRVTKVTTDAVYGVIIKQTGYFAGKYRPHDSEYTVLNEPTFWELVGKGDIYYTLCTSLGVEP